MKKETLENLCVNKNNKAVFQKIKDNIKLCTYTKFKYAGLSNQAIKIANRMLTSGDYDCKFLLPTLYKSDGAYFLACKHSRKVSDLANG